jgi:hypothetical protein
MMKAIAFCQLRVAVAAIALAPVAAPAASPPVSNPKDVKMMHDLARCVAARKTGDVRRLLATDYRTDAYQGAMRQMSRSASGCAKFTGRLRMGGVLMAGALAEAMLARNEAAAPLAQRLAPDPSKPSVVARDEGEFLGLCIARTMPAAVQALLATAPESNAEKASIASLAPNLAPCVQAGASARVNRPALRAILALAAYRLTSSADAAHLAGS